LLSAITYWMYARDKRRAEEGEWRVPEAWLHLLELFGRLARRVSGAAAVAGTMFQGQLPGGVLADCAHVSVRGVRFATELATFPGGAELD